MTGRYPIQSRGLPWPDGVRHADSVFAFVVATTARQALPRIEVPWQQRDRETFEAADVRQERWILEVLGGSEEAPGGRFKLPRGTDLAAALGGCRL